MQRPTLRDNAWLLRTWLNHFSKDFIGLVGDGAHIQAAEVAANMPIAKAAPTYDHSAFILAFTKDNFAHVIYPADINQSDWIHDLPELAREDWASR